MNSLGTAINLTGHQAYVKVTTINNLLGAAYTAVPPALPSFAASTYTGADGTAATQLLELAGADPASGTDAMVFASPQRSAGVSFNGSFRYLGTAPTVVAGKSVLTTLYTAKFGALIAGKKVFIKVVQNQKGMQDNGTTFACIIGT